MRIPPLVMFVAGEGTDEDDERTGEEQGTRRRAAAVVVQSARTPGARGTAEAKAVGSRNLTGPGQAWMVSQPMRWFCRKDKLLINFGFSLKKMPFPLKISSMLVIFIYIYIYIFSQFYEYSKKKREFTK